jgi:ribosomal protein S27AE
MARIVKCPHCGASNPYSLLVTICQQCKGDLAGAEPMEAPVVEAPTQAERPGTLATRTAQVVDAESRSVLVDTPETPSIATGEAGVREEPTGQPTTERRAPDVPPAKAEEPPVAPGLPPEARADARIACGRCGYTNRPGAASCARCGAPLADDTTMALGLRPCPRCGHRQDAQRASCEKCGMHFVGPALQATAALGRQPLRRAPKSLGEDATKGCAVAAGCVIALVMGIVLWVMIALGTMR